MNKTMQYSSLAEIKKEKERGRKMHIVRKKDHGMKY